MSQELSLAQLNIEKDNMAQILQERKNFLFPVEFLKQENDTEIVARPLHISDYDKGLCTYFPRSVKAWEL